MKNTYKNFLSHFLMQRFSRICLTWNNNLPYDASVMLERSFLRVQCYLLYLVHMALFSLSLFNLIIRIMLSVFYVGIYWFNFFFCFCVHLSVDRLCGLVVRVPGYRSRGPGFDSRLYQIFWEVVGLERGPLSLVRIIEELLEWKNSGSGLENRN
jgi:hypothetical protein